MENNGQNRMIESQYGFQVPRYEPWSPGPNGLIRVVQKKGIDGGDGGRDAGPEAQVEMGEREAEEHMGKSEGELQLIRGRGEADRKWRNLYHSEETQQGVEGPDQAGDLHLTKSEKRQNEIGVGAELSSCPEKKCKKYKV